LEREWNMGKIKTWFTGVALAAVVSATSLAAGIPGAPPPFDKDGMKLALVSYISVGDYFQAYEAGVAAQAKAAGIELHIFQGKERRRSTRASRSSSRRRASTTRKCRRSRRTIMKWRASFWNRR
jgi:hypothetical protein